MKYFLIALITLFVISKTINAASSSQTFRISGSTNKGDTVKILLWDHYFGDRKMYSYKVRERVVIADDGEYHFEFDSIHGPVYFSLWVRSGRSRYTLDDFIGMPGDSLYVTQSNYKNIHFTGKGSERIACRLAMDTARFAATKLFNKQAYTPAYLTKREFLRYVQTEFERDEVRAKKISEVLQQFRPRLPKFEYQLLEAELAGQISFSQYTIYTYALASISPVMVNDSIAYFKKQLNDFFAEHAAFPNSKLPGEILALSKRYVKAVAAFTDVEAQRVGIPAYELIKKRYRSTLRDQLLTVYFLDYARNIKDLEPAMERSLPIIKTSYLKETIEYFLYNFLRGSTAYDFALEDASGKMRRLSEFRGKKVVIDFWFTGCAGCASLYQGALKEVESMYANDSSIAFISIANDPDRSIWHQSITSGLYTSPHITNLFTGKPEPIHPVLKRYGVVAAPTLVIVDEQGKIAYNGDAPRTKDSLIALIKSN